jgi:hypothetical protein
MERIKGLIEMIEAEISDDDSEFSGEELSIQVGFYKFH